MRLQNIITQQRLQELLSYDPKTGLFINLTQRQGPAKKGSIAGTKRLDGYIAIQIDGKLYSAHRLAWLYTYGSLPEKDLDHINEIKDDNRIVNLRLATHQQNQQNRSKPYKNNSSGLLGIYWNKQNKKWRAIIEINGKNKHLGYFNTAEQAHDAYLKGKREIHPFWVEDKVA